MQLHNLQYKVLTLTFFTSKRNLDLGAKEYY